MSMFDKFGKVQGYGQIAPGRDAAIQDQPGAPGRPRRQENINTAISGGMPMGGAATPFKGAQQTIGAPPSIANAIAGPPGMAPSMGAAAPMAAPPVDFTRPENRQAPTYKVNLEGFGGMRADGSAKLGSAEHGLKSPKYAFANLMQGGQYGYDQMGEALAELQKTHGDLYNGWSMVPGKEVMRYTGDPSQLNAAWNGVDEVDLVRNFTQDGQFDPSKAAFWWGASTPGERAGQARGPMPSNIGSAIQGQPQVIPGQPDGDYAARLRQQIMQALQANPQLASIGKQFGGY